MQITSALYKQIIADENHSFEVKLDIAGTEYGMDAVFSARGTAKTFETEPTIGGVYSATFDFSLLTDGANIPRMAKVIPYFRATDEARTSEWIKKGEFYIDVRSVTSNGDGLSVFRAQCFDGMLKANAPYANSSLSWPATDTAVVAEICTALGFTQDARNAGIMTAGYSIPSAPVDLTYRDVLSYIAAMYGANWIMTDAGELRLLPLGEGTDTLTVGNNVQNLNVSPKRNGYTKVILETSEGVAIESGASDEVVITAFCPYATQAIADAVLTALSSFEYQPFGAVGVWADPAVEIGDNMSAVTTTGTVFSREIEFGTGMVMNLSAPNDNYTDHEYSYESPTERRYKRSIGGLRSEISIQEGKISLVVSETSGGNVVNAASIVTAINGSSSSVEISADHINLNGAVTANNNVQILQDGTIKAVNADISGTFNMTGGSVRIVTTNETDDIISLNGTSTKTDIYTFGITVSNKSTSASPYRRAILQGGALFMYGDGTESGINKLSISISQNGIFKFDGTRQRWNIADQFIYGYNAQGKQTILLWNNGGDQYFGTEGIPAKIHLRSSLAGTDGIFLNAETGRITVNQVNLGSALTAAAIGAFNTTNPFGFLQLNDTSGAVRAWLEYTGLKFYLSDGQQVGNYPPNFKFFRQEVTLNQQYCVINDSQFRTDSVVFAQLYYSSDQLSLTGTVTPQITTNGACILYFRMPSGTIPDGAKVWVQILIIGGTV